MNLGRGPVTRVKDSKVSRHQVRITWTDDGIYIKQLAENSSFLNTRPLKKVRVYGILGLRFW